MSLPEAFLVTSSSLQRRCNVVHMPPLSSPTTSTITFAAGIVFLAEMMGCALHGLKYECAHIPAAPAAAPLDLSLPVPMSHVCAGQQRSVSPPHHQSRDGDRDGDGVLAAPAVRVWDVGDVSFYAFT